MIVTSSAYAAQNLSAATVAEMAGLYTAGSPYYDDLADGDVCMIFKAGSTREVVAYIYDDDSAQTEDGDIYVTPDYVSPGNAYSGNARWVKMNLKANTADFSGNITCDPLTSTTFPNLFLGTGVAGGGAITHSTGAEGWANCGIGYHPFYAITTGNHNIAIGHTVLDSMTSAIYNTFIGNYAGDSITTSSWNTAIGGKALRNCGGTGSPPAGETVAIGYCALTSCTTGYHNTAIGVNALMSLTSGYGNFGLGQDAGQVLNGNYNVLIGEDAIVNATSGNNNVIIGAESGGTLITGSNNLIIGYQVDVADPNTDNYLNIGGIIYGDTSEQYFGLLGGTTGGLYFDAAEADANITAAATITIQVNVPSGAKLLGCQLRVDWALADGETWNAAYATGSTQSIASAQAVAKNTKVNKFFDENAATAIASDEVDIAIQRNSNPGVDVFTAQGNIRAIVYYQAFTAMGDAS